MKTILSNNFGELGTSIKDYLNIQLDLVKLSMVEKMVKISIFSISLLLVILASCIFFIFAAAAFVIWYGSTYNDYLTGVFIVMGAIVLITLLFYAFRRIVVESFFIKKFASILLQVDEDDD